MRYIIGRFLKNFPFLKKLWLSFSEYIDFKYYKKHCSSYKIIPFGNYCMPRVITCVNRLKPTKKYGEESFPFDLCISDFSLNLKLLTTKFEDFFDKTIYDEHKKCYENKEYKLRFIHDDIPRQMFEERFKNRINNLYNYLKKTSMHLYFIVATFDKISNEAINEFINEINCYRDKNTYDLIIINQYKENIRSEHKNVHIIDLSNDNLFEYINRKGGWSGELKYRKSIKARLFNHKIISRLSKIIK